MWRDDRWLCGAPQPINKKTENEGKREPEKKVKAESNTQAEVVHAPQKMEKLPEVEKAVASEKKMLQQS